MGGSFGKNLMTVMTGGLNLLLGIVDHYETVSDISIQNLLTPGEADESARRNAIRQSKGDANSYFKIYKSFQKDYRRKCSPRFLTSLGYAPSTNASTRVINEAATLSYLQTIVPEANGIRRFIGDYLSDSQIMFNYIQNNYDYTNHTQTLINAGDTWINPSVSRSGNTLTCDFIKEPEEDIVESLQDSYSYDGTYINFDEGTGILELSGIAGVSINETIIEIYESGLLYDSYVFNTSSVKEWSISDSLYDVGNYTIKVIEDSVETDSYPYEVVYYSQYEVTYYDHTVYNISGVNNYRVFAESVSDSNIIEIYLPLTTFSISTAANDFENLYIEYTRSDYDSEFYFTHIELLSGAPTNIYFSETVPMTAIIALKENNVVQDLENYKLKRMLKKLNLKPNDLVDSLANPEMDNAYLMTGIHPHAGGSAIAEALYKSFNYYAPGSGNISISMNQLNMVYTFTISRSTISGSILPVGTYSKTIDTYYVSVSSGDGTSQEARYRMVMRYQGSQSEYKQIIIADYRQKYKISGQTIDTDLNGDAEHSRIIVPLGVLNSLSYKNFVAIYEAGLCLLGYATEEVFVKWYETSIFGAILKMVAFVIIIWTLGSTTSLWVALFKILAVALVVHIVIKVLGPKLGAAVIIAAAIIAAMYGDFTLFGQQFSVGYLQAANVILSTMNQAMQMETDRMIAEGETRLDSIQEQHSELKELLDSMNYNDASATIMMFDDQSSYFSGTLNMPDAYISSMLGEAAFNFDQLYDVDYAYETRKVTQTG
jgi:hypothetical protein